MISGASPKSSREEMELSVSIYSWKPMHSLFTKTPYRSFIHSPHTYRAPAVCQAWSQCWRCSEGQKTKPFFFFLALYSHLGMEDTDKRPKAIKKQSTARQVDLSDSKPSSLLGIGTVYGRCSGERRRPSSVPLSPLPSFLPSFIDSHTPV